MSRFNLNDYETVAQRINRFYTDNPDGRIHTDLLHALEDSQGWRWVVKASVYVGEELKSTGLAEERLNGQGANKDAALENAETSAIGRALANWKYSGDKRASREEMGKSQRYSESPKITPEQQGWLDTLEAAVTPEQVQAIAEDLKANLSPQWLLDAARKRWTEVTS